MLRTAETAIIMPAEMQKQYTDENIGNFKFCFSPFMNKYVMKG